MKFSKKFIEKYQFYLNCPFDFCGKEIKKQKYNENGLSAIESFFNAENGVSTETKEPEDLQKALIGKASINFQIKFWATEIGNGRLLPSELSEFNLPNFVKDAIMGQVYANRR